MIKRTNPDGTVSVTFELTRQVGAGSANLCGDFNGWSQSATALSVDGDIFAVTLQLDAGRRYRFRYLLDGYRWENDWAADEYIPNDFGGEDSVVDLTGVGDRPPPAQPAGAGGGTGPVKAAPATKAAAPAKKAAKAAKAAKATKAAEKPATAEDGGSPEPVKKAAKKAAKAAKKQA